MLLETAYHELYVRVSPELSDASIQRHAFDLKRWHALIPRKDISEITTLDYLDFRRLSAKAGHAPSTTETTIRTVKQILNAAAVMGRLDKVPVSGRSRKISRPTPRPATSEELRRLWLIGTAAARWPRNSAFRTPRAFWKGWIMFAYWTGLRLTDLTWRLSRDHIEPGMIRFRASKTGVEHCIPMRPELWQVINARRPDSGPIFQCYHKPSRLREHLARLCEAADIRKLTCKNFRQAAVCAWSMADATAGQLLHGCGLPGVLKHYLDPGQIMLAAAPRVVWPFDLDG